MKKTFFIIFVLFLFGCTSNTDNKKNNEVYNGELLTVGVMGEEDLPKIKNIYYEKINVNNVDLVNKDIDVLLVTPDAFEEVDKNKYVSTLQEIEYPILFFGMKDFKMFAFTHEDMTIETSQDDNVAYIQGFKNVNGNKEGMKFYKSEETESDINILIRAFNTIESEKMAESEDPS